MHLTVENGPRGRQTVPLAGSLTIGSSPDCGLRIESPGVALHHAIVKPLKGGGFGIKSVDAPIVVDGDDVPAARLREGTGIALGPVLLRIVTTLEDDPIPATVGGAKTTDPGEASPNSPARTSPKALGGYRLLGILGKGGMGVVYRAEQVSLNREVALKVLSKDLTEDPMFVGKFVAEARHAARLHHPNVVQVFDVDHEGDTYFYPMELMEESLEAVIRTKGKLEPERAIAVIRDAASGLAYAESLRIVHRDIKPDNIMLDRHGTAKLCDLGLAQGDEGDKSGKISGTPHFMAPEQALRKPIDHRTDLYALGCTFYRVLTGRTPFQGKNIKEILKAHLKEAPLPPHKIDPDVPADVSPVVLKLLEKEPDDRYQSAEALIEALDALIAPPQRKAMIYGAIGLAVIAVGVAIWYANQDAKVIDRTTTVVDQAAIQEAERLRQQQRESTARIALLEIQGTDLEGIALAKRLEQMAENKAHAGSAAAQEAIQLAGEVRAAVQRKAAERAALQRRVQQTVDDLTTQTRSALAEARWAQAQQLVSLDAVAEDLRNLPELAAAGSSLGEELRQAVATAIKERTDKLAAAAAAADPAALRAEAKNLRGILDGERAWPANLIGDVEALRTAAADAEAAAQVLETAAAKQQRAAAWGQFDQNVVAALSEHIAKLDFPAAAAKWDGLAAAIETEEPATRTGALAESARWAERAVVRIEQAAASENPPTIPHGDDLLVPVIGLNRGGKDAGLTLRVGRTRSKEESVPLGDIAVEQWRELVVATEPEDAAGDPAGIALLALLALERTVTEGQQWLATLDAQDDATGTGKGGFVGTPLLLDYVARRIDGANPDPGAAEGNPTWLAVLGKEIHAAQRLTGALRAISERRNRAGEVLIRTLLEQEPHAMAVLGLQ